MIWSNLQIIASVAHYKHIERYGISGSYLFRNWSSQYSFICLISHLALAVVCYNQPHFAVSYWPQLLTVWWIIIFCIYLLIGWSTMHFRTKPLPVESKVNRYGPGLLSWSQLLYFCPKELSTDDPENNAAVLALNVYCNVALRLFLRC